MVWAAARRRDTVEILQSVIGTETVAANCHRVRSADMTWITRTGGLVCDEHHFTRQCLSAGLWPKLVRGALQLRQMQGIAEIRGFRAR